MAGLGVARQGIRPCTERTGAHLQAWGGERPAQGPPLTSLVSVLNLRFWMVLLSWMLVSNFIIWFTN